MLQRYDNQFRPEFSRLHLDRDLLWMVPFPVRYVVAITGARFAGKSAALAYLSEKRGFDVYSLAFTLREIASERGIPLEPRSRLQDLGDTLRAEHRDPAILARLTLRRILRDHLDQRRRLDSPRRVAVGGFKRPEELVVFESLQHYAQLNVWSHDTKRLARAKASGIFVLETEHIEPTPAPTSRNFRRYIDERDLFGDQRIWTRGFDQAVGRVTANPAAEAVPNNSTLAHLGRALDEHVRRLDERFGAF